MKFEMKFLPAIIALTLTMAGCMSDNPEKSADKFLNAFNERKFDEARKYATVETGKLIDLMENLTKMAPSDEPPASTKIEVLRHTIDGETATVIFKEAETGEEQELQMKKVDGKWLVHVTKEDIAAKDTYLGTGEEEEGYWSGDEDTSATAVDSAATQVESMVE